MPFSDDAALNDLHGYLTNDINKVNGWCDPLLWQVIQPLSEEIKKRAPAQPIAEIGVYHGKFFIGLAKTMNAPRGNSAFDVFDMQEFNKDNAGKGDMEIFQQNLRDNNITEDQVTLIKTDSTWLGASEQIELKRKIGGYSMFSVDGCHTAHHTIRDTHIAMELTHPAGIIFIDDYYNDFWPGVQEGIGKLFHTGAPSFVPLAFLCNKLVMCNVSYHEQYLKQLSDYVRKNHAESRFKYSPRYGFNTMTVRPANTGHPLIA